jgi:hypothetical protein
MPTNDSFWLNEVRIPLDGITNIPADVYVASHLSVHHRRRIEIRLAAQCGRVSRFEGNVLYSIAVDKQATQNCLTHHLSHTIRVFSPENLSTTTLGRVAEPVLERLLFELIRTRAQSAKYFYLSRRTLFQIHGQPSSIGFYSVDIRILLGDDYVRIYLLPSSVALINIENTVRSQVHDLELVRICKFRDICPIWQKDKCCRYAFPDRVGFYEKRVRREALSESAKESLSKAYDGCPKFEEASGNLILVKASPKSKRALPYPTYLLSAIATRQDVQIAGHAQAYREATLQPSRLRFGNTKKVVERIFGTGELFAVKDLEIPFQNVFSVEGSPNPENNNTGYSAAVLETQNISTDPKQLRGRPYGGGWQFQTWGSYDRNDPNRPFKSIHPYLIIPNLDGVSELVGQLLESLVSGYKKKSNSDSDFPGLNGPDDGSKYNVSLDEFQEQDCISVDPNDTGYLSAAQQIKRRFLSREDHPDPNRIVLIVLPDEDVDPDEDSPSPLYFRLKRIFVEEGIPTQFITLGTLRRLKHPTEPFGSVLWNLFLDIYVKLGGKPWRLARQVSNVHCFIGIGFALNPRADEKNIYAGVANVFDRYGNWLDITSAYETLTDEEREDFYSRSAFLEGTASFKISQSTTYSIVTNSLELYREKQTQSRLLPRNIILHKLGRIYQCEVEGMLEAISNTVGTLENCRIGIASIHTHHLLRLYGIPDNNSKTSRVVLRGTRVLLHPNTALIATTGRIYRQTPSKTINFYPGIGTPRPLLIENVIPDQMLRNKYKLNENQFYSTSELSAHIFALTHLHWGSIREDIRLPITVLYAKRVADIISKSGILRLDTGMSLRRPWFI